MIKCDQYDDSVIKTMMITIAIKLMTVDDSQPEPAFLHYTVLESCFERIVVVPFKKFY